MLPRLTGRLWYNQPQTRKAPPLDQRGPIGSSDFCGVPWVDWNSKRVAWEGILPVGRATAPFVDSQEFYLAWQSRFWATHFFRLNCPQNNYRLSVCVPNFTNLADIITAPSGLSTHFGLGKSIPIRLKRYVFPLKSERRYLLASPQIKAPDIAVSKDKGVWPFGCCNPVLTSKPDG